MNGEATITIEIHRPTTFKITDVKSGRFFIKEDHIRPLSPSYTTQPHLYMKLPRYARTMGDLIDACELAQQLGNKSFKLDVNTANAIVNGQVAYDLSAKTTCVIQECEELIPVDIEIIAKVE
jgi:hypothetical protein